MASRAINNLIPNFNRNYPLSQQLPNHLLALVLQNISSLDQGRAARVCRNWNAAVKCMESYRQRVAFLNAAVMKPTMMDYEVPY